LIHLEGRQAIEAALAVGRRRIEAILVQEGADEEKLASLLSAAKRRAVVVRRVGAAEFDGVVHGSSHGGVAALCDPLPTTSEPELLALLDGRTTPPLLLLLEGISDDRNLGFTLRSAEALGLNVCGVDLLRSNRGPVVLEVNSSPGIEGMEAASRVDVAGAIIEFLEKSAKPGETGTRGVKG